NDGLSQTGDVVGTLHYMAPEALNGRPDKPSDVYSLGLTLYELLTLRPAFRQGSQAEIVQRIMQGQVAPPRSLNASVPRDLETIVLKAIAREPSHRYASAGELAEDLQRFLDDRPIRARRATAVERLWRWARRHRAVAALSATSLALLMLVAVTATWAFFQTRAALEGEQRQRQKVEATAQLASGTLDRIFAKFAPATTDIYDRDYANYDADLNDGDAELATETGEASLSPEASALLQELLVFYDELAAQHSEDPSLRLKAAETRQRVGDIHRQLGQYAEAAQAYGQAAANLESLGDDDSESPLALARVRNEMGRALHSLGMRREAREAHLQALDILATELRRRPDAEEVRLEIARIRLMLAERPRPNLLANGPAGVGMDSALDQGGPERSAGRTSLEPPLLGALPLGGDPRDRFHPLGGRRGDGPRGHGPPGDHGPPGGRDLDAPPDAEQQLHEAVAVLTEVDVQGASPELRQLL
ncbi:MAG: protein kinase, partial [Planctomycetales bacterium]|nr:protein kinase [Planctomycetales bacterium]